MVKGKGRPTRATAKTTKQPAKKTAKKVAKKRTARRPVTTGSRSALKARGPSSSQVREDVVRAAGPRGTKLYDQLSRAADALDADREKEALKLLRPLLSALPQIPAVHELMGVALYRAGRYGDAAEELELYVAGARAVDQHPTLMDCYRAEREWKRVDRLWGELSAVSAAPEVVAEGRIVLAGSLADRGRVREALAVLARRGGEVKDPKEHHLRVWYALADLEERAGNLPRARSLFERVSRRDPNFADVMERLVALG